MSRAFKAIALPPPELPECRKCRTVLLTEHERGAGVCNRCEPQGLLRCGVLVMHLQLAAASLRTCGDCLDQGWRLSLQQRSELRGEIVEVREAIQLLGARLGKGRRERGVAE